MKKNIAFLLPFLLSFIFCKQEDKKLNTTYTTATLILDSVQLNKSKIRLRHGMTDSGIVLKVNFGMEGFAPVQYEIAFDSKEDTSGKLFWQFNGNIVKGLNKSGHTDFGYYQIESTLQPFILKKEVQNMTFHGTYRVIYKSTPNRKFIKDYGYKYEFRFKTGELVPSKDGNKGYYPLIFDYSILEKSDTAFVGELIDNITPKIWIEND
jgi:hypothetical protein